MNTTLRPARLVPPGRILKRELDSRGWTQKELAKIMGRPEQMISEIINAAKQITPETAVELSAALGPSPEFWLNLESKYRLQLAEQQVQTESIARRSQLYGLLPLKELNKRSWIKIPDSIEDLEREVCDYLGILSITEAPSLVASFRQSTCKAPHYPSQLAWLKRVEHLARKQNVQPFYLAKANEAIPDLLKLSVNPKDISHVPNLLAEIGIYFIIAPHLPKTYLDGALFYIQDHPVVALSLRYDRIDSFWFTLMHELGHLIKQHSGIFFDDLDEASEDEKEIEANKFSQDWLVPPDAFNEFVKSQLCFSRVAIERFASEISRHPGIVLGRLHYSNLVPYQNFRRLLTNVSPFLGA